MAIQTDFGSPRFLQRAKAVTPTMPLYEAGTSVVSVDSGTYTLYDGNGETAFTDSVTVVSGVATCPLLASDLPATLQLASNWYEEWDLTLTDGRTEIVRRDVYLCLRTLYPPVNEKMLQRRISDLQNLKRNESDNFSGYLNDAWEEIEARLVQAGKRPYLITNSWALRKLMMELTIQHIMDDASTYMGDGGRYQDRAEKAAEAAERAWGALSLEYDESELGRRGDGSVVGGPAVIYLNRPPAYGTVS